MRWRRCRSGRLSLLLLSRVVMIFVVDGRGLVRLLVRGLVLFFVLGEEIVVAWVLMAAVRGVVVVVVMTVGLVLWKGSPPCLELPLSRRVSPIPAVL